MTLTKSQQLAMEAFEAGYSFFLTGKAGTGKSFVTRQIIDSCKASGKQVLVCAPTGIAAINVGGVTIHSAFRAPVGIIEPGKRCVDSRKIKILEAADVILIDEISMCRLDLFEYVTNSIKSLKKKKQLILVGDFYQLPPVITESEEEAYKRVYDSIYPFQSPLWDAMGIKTIELKECVRTQEKDLVKALDNIRVGIPSFDIFKSSDKPDKQAVSLATTNKRADEINQEGLRKLKNPEFLEARVVDNFPEKDMPTNKTLKVAPGARVMLLNNTDHWVNGTLGTLKTISDDYVTISLDNGETYPVQRNKWEAKEYRTAEEKDERGKKKTVLKQYTIGEFHQFPIKLAWAITVHKSQGQTYDRVNIYPERFFSPGQMYVALSRCKTLDGMNIIGTLTKKGLICSKEVINFMAGNKAVKSLKLGGKREGAGRKAKFGHKTKLYRLPEYSAEQESLLYELARMLLEPEKAAILHEFIKK